MGPSATAHRARVDANAPEPIATALQFAQDSNRYLFVSFSTEGCDICDDLERKVLENRRVRRELDRFVVLNLDLELTPEVSEYYGVERTPAIMALDTNGAERFRWWGMLSVQELLRLLEDRTPPKQDVDPELTAGLSFTPIDLESQTPGQRPPYSTLRSLAPSLPQTPPPPRSQAQASAPASSSRQPAEPQPTPEPAGPSVPTATGRSDPDARATH